MAQDSGALTVIMKNGKKEDKTMKRTFMKILSIAAVILLATSCIKDGDNGDSNVVSPESEVVTPNNEAKGVPFSIKAVTNVAQSCWHTPMMVRR